MVLFRMKKSVKLALVSLLSLSVVPFGAWAKSKNAIESLQEQIADLKVEYEGIDESISDNEKTLAELKNCLKNPRDPACRDANPGSCECWPTSAQGGVCPVAVFLDKEEAVLGLPEFKTVRSRALKGDVLVFSADPKEDLKARAEEVFHVVFGDDEKFPVTKNKVTPYYSNSLSYEQKKAACKLLEPQVNQLDTTCAAAVESCMGTKLPAEVRQVAGNIEEAKKRKKKVETQLKEAQVQLQTTIKACPECAKGGSGTLDAIVGITQAVAPVVGMGIYANAQMKMANKNADMYSAYLNNNYLAYQESVQQCITLGIPCNGYQVSAPWGGMGGIGGMGIGAGIGAGIGGMGAFSGGGMYANGIASAIASAFSGSMGMGSFGYSPMMATAMGYPSMGMGSFGMSYGMPGMGSFGMGSVGMGGGIANVIGNAFTGGGMYGGGGYGYSPAIAMAMGGSYGMPGMGMMGGVGGGYGTYGNGIGMYGGGFGVYGGGIGMDPSYMLNMQMQGQNQQNMMIAQQQMMEAQFRYQQTMNNSYYSGMYGGGIGMYGGMVGGYGYPMTGGGSAFINAIGTAIGTGITGGVGGYYPYMNTGNPASMTGGGSTF